MIFGKEIKLEELFQFNKNNCKTNNVVRKRLSIALKLYFAIIKNKQTLVIKKYTFAAIFNFSFG